MTRRSGPLLAGMAALALAAPACAQSIWFNAPAPLPAPSIGAEKRALIEEFMALTETAQVYDALVPDMAAEYAKVFADGYDGDPSVERIAREEFEVAFRQTRETALYTTVLAMHEAYDETTLRGVIAFYKTAAGRRFVAAQTDFNRRHLDYQTRYTRELYNVVIPRIVDRLDAADLDDQQRQGVLQ